MFLNELNKILINVYYNYLNDVIGGYVIRALFGLIIVVTTLTNSVSATNTAETNVASKLKRFITGINEVLNPQDNTRMFVITVTRISKYKTKRIKQNELEDVVNVISNLCIRKDFTRNSTSGTVVGADLKTQIRKIHKDYNNMENCTKIVVFNEMFFAQEEPLSSSDKEVIESALYSLSKADKLLLLCPNFLFLEKPKTVSKADMNLIANNHKTFLSEGKMRIDERCNAAFAEKIKNTLSSTKVSFDITPLINKSICIHNGTTLIEYMKSTYCRESDSNLIDASKDCWYFFGNGDDQLVKNNELSQFLLANMSFEICFDLANEIRKKRNKDSKLHILQSNWIDSTCYQCQKNLVENRLIIHVDPVVTVGNFECDVVRKFGNTLSKQKFKLEEHLIKKISKFKIKASDSDEIMFVVYEMGF